MNDWSRLAVDLTERKNSGPKNELHEYKYAFDNGERARPVRKRQANNASLGKGSEGELRLSLTITYHEWPVKGGGYLVSNTSGFS
jgi:hypothetical protein